MNTLNFTEIDRGMFESDVFTPTKTNITIQVAFPDKIKGGVTLYRSLDGVNFANFESSVIKWWAMPHDVVISTVSGFVAGESFKLVATEKPKSASCGWIE